MVRTTARIRRIFKLTADFTGKQWHDNKAAFRPRANQTSWDKRTADRKALAAVKAKEKEMKEEKEAERQVRYLCARLRKSRLTGDTAAS